ncbi:LicD family protein [uncultured Psychrobacter sp.]|uniref:LicD family protein n=1 Tax=uncultured Psychrobacter sp. TaxID=259303 RepID=UPI00260CF1B7|nr:LicD family protein [uncultured Psychrobacter sp.]
MTIVETKNKELEDFAVYNGEGTNLRKAQLRLLDILLEFDRICKKHNIQYFLSGGTCLGAVRHGGFIPWDDDIDIDVWHTDYAKLIKILPNELSNNFFMQTDKTDPSFYRDYMRIVDKNSKVVYKDNRSRDKFKYPGLWLDILPLDKTISYKVKKNVEYLYSGSQTHLYGYKNGKLKKKIALVTYPVSLLLIKNINIISKVAAPKDKICHLFGTGMTPKLKRKNCFPVKLMIFEGFEFLGPAKPHEYLLDLYGENYKEIPSKSKRQAHADIIEVYELK